MHRALRIPEICWNICSMLRDDKKALAALARTAKVFSYPAAAELWYEPKSLGSLINTFGSEVFRQNALKQWSCLRSPNSAEWARFRSYAQLVRTLAIIPSELMWLNMVSAGHHPLFPRLYELRANVLNLFQKPIITILFVPSLKIFRLSSPITAELPITETVIESLAISSPHLEVLTISYPRWKLGTVANIKFGRSSCSFPYLSTIRVPLIGALVNSFLSQLSTLRHLVSIDFDIAGDIQIHSRQALTFTSVTSLTLFGPSNECMSIMNILRFPSLSIIKFCHEGFFPLTRPFIDSVALCSGPELSTFAMAKFLQGSEFPAQTEPPNFHVFEPLLGFPKLLSITVSNSELIYLQPKDMEQIKYSWPLLGNLHLHSSFYGRDVSHTVPTLTLTDLVSFAVQSPKCTKIAVHVNAVDITPITVTMRIEPLTLEIQPEFSPIEDARAVAEFLGKAFKSIRLVFTSRFSTPSKWENTEILLKKYIR